MIEYRGKLVLAPMVRVSELPLRKLSLKYGADLVWGPEIIDKRMIASRRVVNNELNTVDFVLEKDPTKLTFRTCPQESSRLVFQLGSSDAELAVRAAKRVARDVAAIDLNCGCPKHFSVHSGMGAQLLQAPDKLCGILESLVEHVGKPYDISISAKIRILDSAQRTNELVKRIVRTGISCLIVHCRTTPMRPREPPIYEQLSSVASICHEAGIPCLVNGGVANRGQMQYFMSRFGVDGAMIARGAQTNPSCFSEQPPIPILQICREFLDACFAYDFNLAHAKYNLTNFIGGKSSLYANFARSRSKKELDEHLREHEHPNKRPASPQESSAKHSKENLAVVP